jgi:hypothetical protein
VAVFDRDRASITVADRIRQDVDSGLASGQVLGTPTLFIDGVVHRAGYLAGRAGPGKPLCSHALAEWRWNCASYLMMRPPSAHSTWPVIAAAASEAK